MARRIFVQVPAQAVVPEMLVSFKEVPPRAKAASFTVSDAMEKIERLIPIKTEGSSFFPGVRAKAGASDRFKGVKGRRINHSRRCMSPVSFGEDTSQQVTAVHSDDRLQWVETSRCLTMYEGPHLV